MLIFLDFHWASYIELPSVNFVFLYIFMTLYGTAFLSLLACTIQHQLCNCINFDCHPFTRTFSFCVNMHSWYVNHDEEKGQFPDKFYQC